MEEPTEVWHQHIIYEIGTKIKKINEKLYKNTEPHKRPTPIHENMVVNKL